MKFSSVSLLLLVALLTGNCSATKKSDDAPMRVKILTYNIHNAQGMDDVTDFDRIATVINRVNADYVALQELDSATQRSGGVVVLDELAKRTGMYAVYGASIDYRGGKYGIGILTKKKPLQHRSVPLPGSEEKRRLLLVETADCVIGCTHWSLTESDRLASVEPINRAVEGYGDKPVFLAGDLNCIPQSEEMALLTKEWSVLNDSLRPTIPAENPESCIDYLLFKNNPLFNVRIVAAEVEQEPVASDHLPVWVSAEVRRNEPSGGTSRAN